MKGFGYAMILLLVCYHCIEGCTHLMVVFLIIIEVYDNGDIGCYLVWFV